MLNKVLLLTLAIGLYFASVATYQAKSQTNAKGKSQVYSISSVGSAKDGYSVDFKFEQDGRERSFAELTKGKVVFLNFWGTWCGPCRREIPEIIEINKDLKGKDFIIIGIAMEQPQTISASDAAKKVMDFGTDKGVNYINFVADPKVTNDIKNAYGKIPAVPTTFIIDKNRKIVEKIVGGRDKATFMTAINKVLK
jgi:thiol-disulfide isomerase/thioredoxin